MSSNKVGSIDRRTAKIGLLHHVGGGNLGDDATLNVVVHNIKRRWPDAVIAAFSINPDDTAKRHGLPSYPISTKTWAFGYKPSRTDTSLKGTVKVLASRYPILLRLLRAINATVIRLPRACWRELSFLANSHRIIRSFDLLVISGGGQLTEWGGPWAFPYTIFKWVSLARLARVRCLFLNVGAGPLNHPLSKFFVARALRAADYVSFRDARSRALAQDIGFAGDGHVFPDSAYSLEVPKPAVDMLQKPIHWRVGIAPMPYCDPRVDPGEKDQAVYESFIAKLAVFASTLVRQSYSLTLFGTDIGVDPLALADFKMALRNCDDVATAEYDSANSLEDLLLTMSSMDYIVTCRFHGVVFAHLLNKPVLAIAHHPKVTTLMNDLGLSEYCVDIRQIDPHILADKFACLVRDTAKIKSQMAGRLAEYQLGLAGQFDALFRSRGN